MPGRRESERFSLADEKNTEEPLIAEPEPAGPGAPAPTQDVEAVASTPSTRRGVLRWIAPVVLFVGTTLKPSAAQAADDFVGAEVIGRCTPRP
jgi:hypothetical protein